MKLLLDTHTFIWWSSAPNKLSPKALALCQDASNRVLLSVTSVWEMQIKHQLGKLRLDLPLGDLISEQREINRIEVLPITLPHVLVLESLPFHHKDPFDRLLIAQANSEGAVLVTKDPAFEEYPVKLIW
jgi:PIN domain nuclease of toxin-antitoxin system